MPSNRFFLLPFFAMMLFVDYDYDDDGDDLGVALKYIAHIDREKDDEYKKKKNQFL